jgi:hypothetical protein
VKEHDAMSLLNHLRLRGYTAHAEFIDDNGTFRWRVVATKLRTA